MSDIPNDGGPAFPARPTEHMAGGYMITAHHGMSLRDWFAGQALVRVMMMNRPDHHGPADWLAGQSYEIADAMLAARAAK